MPTDEIIIRLFCMAYDQFASVNKRSDVHLYLSEIVTIGLLFRPLATAYDGETIALADQGLRAKAIPPQKYQMLRTRTLA
jgi:hypothetical protein